VLAVGGTDSGGVSAAPNNPSAAFYGLGIAQFGPLLGHDGQIPGGMTFMGHDPKERPDRSSSGRT
jgi:hypothetical protein